MNQIDFTEFLIYNKKEILTDLKPQVNSLLDKRKHFKHEFLLEYDFKLNTNIWILLRNYLINKLELNYLQTEELMLECKVINNFLEKDNYK